MEIAANRKKVNHGMEYGLEVNFYRPHGCSQGAQGAEHPLCLGVWARFMNLLQFSVQSEAKFN